MYLHRNKISTSTTKILYKQKHKAKVPQLKTNAFLASKTNCIAYLIKASK